MKRYVLFGGDQYYPSGGMHDLVGDFESADQAAERAKLGYDWGDSVERDEYDWWHVLDLETWEVVRTGYGKIVGSNGSMAMGSDKHGW